MQGGGGVDAGELEGSPCLRPFDVLGVHVGRDHVVSVVLGELRKSPERLRAEVLDVAVRHGVTVHWA